ncbi:MAG: autotransporter domain-containing protein, partial [Pseudomonadota bacterium]
EGLTIKAYGDVYGTGNDGIFANNSSNGTGVSITTGADTVVEGGDDGIYALNEGSEGLTIKANGDVYGYASDGIYAKNYGTSVNIMTGPDTTVSGVQRGVFARNFGSEGLSVTAYGNVYGGSYDGIFAQNGTVPNPTGTSLNITTGAETTVRGGTGILTRNFGSKGLTIKAYGNVYGTDGDGIFAFNSSNGTSLKVTTGIGTTVEGSRGISAFNYGSDGLTIVTYGDVTGEDTNGIFAANFGIGTGLEITTGTDTTVTGEDVGIIARNYGDAALTVTAYGDVIGKASDGIVARSDGSAVNVTTGGGTTITGAGGTGIFARSLGSQGNNAITVTVQGAVIGTDGDGITAEHQGNGPIAITVGATGTVTSNGTDADDFAIETIGGPSNVTVAGTLNGGAGGAVQFDGTYALDDRFELHTTGVVNGDVFAEGGTDTLAFGGTGDGAFNLDDIDTGAETQQYQGCELFDVESGDWRFSGSTTAAFTVNGGTLGGNPTFGGLSVLGGTLSPGNSFGTVTVNGDFAMAAESVLEIEVDASGLNDNVVVMGSVDIDDATLRVLTEIGAYAPSTDYTIIDNDGTDAITGSFAVITSSLAFLDPTVIYDGGDGNDVVLNLQRNATFFQDVALTRNQRQVASVLDQLPTDNPVLLAVANQTEAGAREAFNALLGEIYLNLETTTLFASQAFSDDLFSCPAYGEGSAAIAEGQCAWLRPQGGMRSFDGTAENIGFEQRWGGFSTGIQTALTPSWYANLAFGYQQGRLDTDTRAQGLSDTYQAGLSIKYQEGPWLFGAALSGGVADHETERPIAIGSFSTVARSDHQTGFVTGQLRAAYEAEFGAFYARPSIDAWLTYLNRDGFTETDGGAANLSIAGSDGSYFSVSPAIELGGRFAAGENTTIRPFVKAGFTYFANNEHELIAQFATAPSGIATFSTTSTFDDLFADVEVGVEMLRLDGASLSFGYQGKIAEDSAQHSGYVKGGVRF